MTWKVSTDPVDFDDAIAWFRKRVAMTKADYERLSATAKRKAFVVASVAQVDVVQQAWTAIDKAIKDGTSLDDFKKAIGPALLKAWAGSVGDEAWRLETIFRTNVQSAYAAGRWRQATHPDVASDRPVWMFDAVLDGRETPICRACDGTKLPNDDAWWKTHLPPLHFNCRSAFVALTDGEAGKITLHPPTAKPTDDFGLTPAEDEWKPQPQNYPPPVANVLQQKLAAAPPLPPPSKLVAGTHFGRQAVDNGVSSVEVDDVLGGISDAETLKWLEQNPIGVLGLRKQARDGKHDVNGFWELSGTGTRLELTVHRAATSFGRPFVAGKVHSISSSQSTKDAAAKATLRHELGHHIHLLENVGSKVDKIVEVAYLRARAAKVFITSYAMSNRHEYFAESYAAYYLRRSDLKAHDPNGFKMVEDVLKQRGIIP